MTTLTMAGTLLRASEDDRILTYLLAPFNTPGRTSLGTVTLTASSLTIPEDVTGLVVNQEHVPTVPVGKFARVEATEAGYEADVRFLSTRAGDDALLEAKEGVRKGISVEVANPVIRKGQMLSGSLHGAGVCVAPAFPSALLVAADAGDLSVDVEVKDENVVVINGVEYLLQENGTYAPKQTPEDPPPGQQSAAAAAEEDKMGNSLTAATVAAAGVGTPPPATTKPELTADQVFKMVATAYKTNNNALLTAALANVVHDDGDNDGDGLGEIAAAPSWLGEVWSATTYQRKYIPLISTGPLTSMKETGFNFATLPVVGKYSGNKTDVPTGGMTVLPVTFVIDQWAHAADLDRRFIDFQDTGVVRAFIEAQVNSYRKVTDIETALDIVANANAFTVGTVPVNINATLAAIVDGALALLANDFSPNFAIVGSGIYRSLALTPKDLVPEYLSATVGLESGSADGFKIIPSSLPQYTGKVVVGDGRTVKFKELGGGTPVRVEAEHVAQRGRDLGVFGYTSYQELIDGGVVVATLV